MTEPLSLAALIRARAKHLIIAGDPCQLGPILATPASVTLPGDYRTIDRPAFTYMLYNR